MSGAVNIESFSRCLLDYDKAGFSLVPLSGQRPIPGWSRRGYDSREALRQLEQEPGNIGILTGRRSRLVVLDYDEAEAGLAFSEAYYDKTGARPTTIQSGGDRGGLHYYFSLREGERVKSRNIYHRGKEAGHFIAEGEYWLVAAPPSLHPETGRPYRFLVGLENLSPWGPEVEEISGVEPEPVAEKQYGIPGIADGKRGLACVAEVKSRSIPYGQRGKVFFTLYWVLLENGDKKEYAERQVRELNSRAEPPMTEAELKGRGIFKGRKPYRFTCETKRERFNIDLAVCENCLFHSNKGAKVIGARELDTMLHASNLRGLPLTVWLGVRAGKFDVSNKTATADTLGVTRQGVDIAVKKLQEAGIKL